MAHLSPIMNTIVMHCKHQNDVEFKLESRHVLIDGEVVTVVERNQIKPKLLGLTLQENIP